MENYIVRIYRRNSADPERVNGVLESVEQETQQPFADLNTLSTMLARKPEASPTESTSSGNSAQPTLSLAK